MVFQPWNLYLVESVAIFADPLLLRQERSHHSERYSQSSCMPPKCLRLILPKVLALFFVTYAKFLEFRTITIETIPPIINLQPMVVRFIRKLIIGSGMLQDFA
jgi:hypothetical protein